MGGKLYFAANDGVRGRELWRTDGTQTGTVLVKNIRPDDPGHPRSSGPQHLTVVRGVLYFTADDGVRGRELWKSDGTRSGTVLVKDIATRRSSRPVELTRVGRRLFFTAFQGKHRRELWRSNGTARGTVLVKDISPAALWNILYIDGGPRDLTAVGDRVFFAAISDTEFNLELWRSDGTRRGTVLVKDISREDHPDWISEGPQELTSFDGKLFFSAARWGESDADREPWRSDGSRTGTVLLRDINPGTDSWDYPASSAPSGFTAAGGRLFFSAEQSSSGRELWSTDGTRSGTAMIADIAPTTTTDEDGAVVGASSNPKLITRLGKDVFFSAHDETHGTELWTSDGTSPGTRLVKDVSTEDAADAGPASLTAVGPLLLFSADDGTHGRELWRSDGTSDGTWMVKDVASCESGRDSRPRSLTALGERLYFAADDGIHGTELWVSDGTAEGTRLVKDIRTGSAP